MKEVLRYFPDITELQKKQLEQLLEIFPKYNQKVNLISRNDVQNLEVRHILHSLSIAKIFNLPDKISVLDVGTGGGFPGIPLAILYPSAKFYLVDSIQKKINVVSSIVKDLELKNVHPIRSRAEELDIKVDLIISRAVAPMKKIWSWTNSCLIKNKEKNHIFGYLFLKGGDLDEELKELGKKYTSYLLNNYFDNNFFQGKALISIKI